MAENFGIQGAGNGVQSNLPGVGSGSQAAEAATKLPQAPTRDTGALQTPSVANTTAYMSDPAISTPAHSRVVQRLLQQNATIYGPGLARVPLPPRPEDVPRTTPKKPASPMVAPRSLEGGRSPLAPGSLWDARASIMALGIVPTNVPGEA